VNSLAFMAVEEACLAAGAKAEAAAIREARTAVFILDVCCCGCFANLFEIMREPRRGTTKCVSSLRRKIFAKIFEDENNSELQGVCVPRQFIQLF
jgi:hypothetical protein